jgi:uncharacterized protein (TIGR03790 family)
MRLGLAILVASLVPSLIGCQPDSAWEFGEETRVLLVFREHDAAAGRIARRYVAARSLAGSHVLAIACPDGETIPRSVYSALIEAPIAAWWRDCAEQQRPDYLVLVKGLPHRIDGSGGMGGIRASVDSELTRIPRVAAGEQPLLPGPERNRYFDARDAPGEYAAFDWRSFGLCLVCRLDGYTEADAIALIERALDAGTAGPMQAPGGSFLIDLRGGSDGVGQSWLRRAAQEVTTRGGMVVLDEAPTFMAECDDLIGYASWGSNDPAYQRPFRLQFRAGALACTFVSSSARTFREPPGDWTPGPSAKGEHRFEGTTQSLIADFVRSGATGASGNVYEPFLSGCVRPDILFGAFLDGRTLGESFYLALPGISWQTVVLGDPLCAPHAIASE